MDDRATKEAWVELPSEAELRKLMPPGSPYDFGFLPAMARLSLAHDEIGPLFGMLFAKLMFETDGPLSRSERELVAAVAAAGQDCFY